ncbi:MAG: efflux RND transporter periplasmic adaptor subunit [Gemmatimonadaceae bacterium]|nr:efflux RND transporter periplasmic adaptor subunit [Gemmatimonadaceae bacterium]
MTTTRRMAPTATSIALLASALMLGACNKAKEAVATTAATAQTIGPDNIAVATTDTLRSGPAISGTLVADREARIRAEIGGAVLHTYVDAGQRVAAGTPLARIDDGVLQDAALSARSNVTQATVGADQAARELKRAKTLVAAGAIAERDVEGAERANVSAQAQLADANSRLSTMEKNLRNATIRAPFAGIVAEKSVSPGDIVAPGAALFTVIDPRSLKVEASVPTSALADVRVGAPVMFTVNGSDRQLEGRITRVSPMVDPQTKQVSLLATVPNAQNALVAGLFVEGRIAAEKRIGILVPEKAVDQTGIVPIVMRLKGGKVERVEVQVGVRDEGAETLEIRSGLAGGDTVLLGAARGISVGSSVVVSSPKDAPAAPVKNN